MLAGDSYFLSYKTVAQSDECDAESNAYGDIACEAPYIARLQHNQRFFGEGGECCEASAESDCQEDGPVAALIARTAEKAPEHSNQEASQKVCGECGPWKALSYILHQH